MATKINRLSDRAVRGSLKPGRHADGGNLYLNVSATGAKSWVFLFKMNGKQREMGLGPLLDVTLAEAREKAGTARKAVLAGLDPIDERNRPAPVVVTTPTFKACADSFLSNMEPSWRNPKHRAQWKMTLSIYAAPLHAKPVADISVADVLAVLEPVWSQKPETAHRLRGRIEAVLDYAKVAGHRSGENPATWRGNLKHALPARAVHSKGHHEAMPYKEVPAFMKRLVEVEGMSARALEFTILTAARSGEALGATWAEFNDELTIWTIPAARMKAGREHRVPLTESVKTVLVKLRALRGPRTGDFVFFGQKYGRPLSNMVLAMCLRRLGEAVTAHGFRSSFRDWTSECTNFPSEICEMALAHAIGSKVEAAYRRGDLFEKRREVMTTWSAYCTSERDPH